MPVCLKCGTERSSHYRLCLCEPGGLAERSNEQTSDLRSRITTLEAQLTHLQEQAGPDSCADLMVRCERAEARAERYEKCLRKLLTHLPPPPDQYRRL